MRFKLFAFIWFAALAAAPLTLSADSTLDHPAAGCCDKPAMACCDKPAATADDAPAPGCCQDSATHKHAATGCCDQPGGCDMPCCQSGGTCDMPCCRDKAQAIAVDGDAIEILFAMSGQKILPPTAPIPTRQTAVVLFQRPVWVGNTVLMGKYVIEHDTLRQARGEPCTHIFAASNLETPVATFHCTHLDVAPTGTDVVVLHSNPDGSRRFVQFQFKGEDAAHGYPTER